MENFSDQRLKPKLGLFDATAIGLGSIIGGGIFVVTGIVAGLAGPALVLSILIAAAISLLTALSFVELTAWLPAEGSVFVFAHKLLSPFAGFLAGWMWIVSNIFSGAAVSLGFAHYLAAMIPALHFRWIVVVVCLSFTLLNYLGIRHSASLNNGLVTAKIIILIFFVAVGLFYLKPANFTPFIRSGTGIFHGAYFIFFAFAGFGRVSVIAEEVKDARKTVPLSIILSLTISAVIYILVGTVALGLAKPERLAQSDSPLAEAIGAAGHPFFVYVVSLGGLIAMASVLLNSILGVSRMAYAMSRANDLPRFLGKLQPRFSTPYVSIFAVGLLTTLSALFLHLNRVVAVSTFASLFYYGLANISALRLKAGSRLHPRFLPALGLTACLALLVFVPRQTLALGIICLLAGVLFYQGRKVLSKDGENPARSS